MMEEVQNKVHALSIVEATILVANDYMQQRQKTIPTVAIGKNSLLGSGVVMLCSTAAAPKGVLLLHYYTLHLFTAAEVQLQCFAPLQ